MPGPLTLAQIAARLGGRVVGDAEVLISQVGSLESARAGQIAFLANPKYRASLATTRAGAVVLAPATEALTRLPRIVSDNPYAYFARLSQLFNPVGIPQPGIDATAIVSPRATVPQSARIEAGAVIGDGARLGERVSIGAGCHLGANVAIGDDSRLYPSVVVYAGCRIGARAMIHSGVVIGADGFGIAEDAGVWVKVPQIGAVIVGDDVEIGANTTIDRGTIDDTVIEDGVKLDNQIQIGHNVRVGAHTAMAGFSGVAGSADIGRHCTIGAAAIILGHLTIVDHVHVSAATVISRSIRQPGTYSGVFPFDEHASWVRNAALVRHLDELAQRVRALEKHIAGEGKDE
ncbi:MAG TPA: UDP-3-O-(3-hydroxymyristoyl)glucosamine N-acyltransferase [Burkholderiales bacterium]|nr:UDP-3-O-(3-hydroxymyristoyl)glucosamine N-acyltransferase [Burkholderiales bacterium]